MEEIAPKRKRLYDDRRWNIEEEKEIIGLQKSIIKINLSKLRNNLILL